MLPHATATPRLPTLHCSQHADTQPQPASPADSPCMRRSTGNSNLSGALRARGFISHRCQAQGAHLMVVAPHERAATHEVIAKAHELVDQR